MNTITIKVLPEHISAGNKSNPFTCPIALAMEMALGFPVSCVSPYWRDYTNPKNWSTRYKLPAFLESVITTFDNGGGMNPFEFKINLDEIHSC